MKANLNCDLTICGFGMVSSFGVGISKNIEALNADVSSEDPEKYFVKNFDPSPYLTDRKIVKVISHRDVLGMVAFEDCLRNSKGFLHKDPDRCGIYVGAPPSACSDSLNYAEAIESSVDMHGTFVEAEFGKHFASASPTTLLAGLPNNVLCYAAKTIDARGPNSNYTALEMSGHMALIQAAQAIRRGRLDRAVVGGYSAHSDKVFLESMRCHNQLKSAKSEGLVIAEGSVFLTLESQADASQSGRVKFLTGGLGSDAQGPNFESATGERLARTVFNALASANVSTQDVGAVMVTGSGQRILDENESNMLRLVFGDDLPLIASPTKIWGHLMEAGGLADIAYLQTAAQTGKVAPSCLLFGSLNHWDKSERPIGIVVRSSGWGDYSVLVLEFC